MSLLASIPRTYPASLLLNFDGTNNSTTFTDSSSNNLTATRNGNTIISTTESKFGNSSGYFDGTGDYLAFSGTEFNFASSDFTIEAWIRPSSVTGTRVIFSKRANTSTYGGFIFQCNGNKLNILATNNGSSWGINLDSTSTLSTNTWYHVAVTRNNNTFRIFLNGIEVGSQTINSFIISTNADNVVIGAGGATGGQEFFGYIDDLRITKNIVLYQTGYFIPPTSSLSKNATIAPKLYNHIVMTSTKSSGDITGYISTSTGYYTVNWWDGTKTTYPSDSNFAKAAIGGNQIITIYPSSSNGSLDGYFYNVNVSNNNLTSVRPFYSRFTISPGINATFTSWRTRWSNSAGGYVGYTYTGNIYTPGTPYNLDISSNSLDASALNQIYNDLLNGNGSIDVSDNTGGDSDNPSIATTKGYTVYGSLAPILSALFNFDGTNSTTFTDSSSYNHVPTRFGNTIISTAQSKFGGSSAYFDGTGDYLSIAANSVFAMGKDDFTVECWVYPTSFPTSDLGAIVENRSTSSSGGFLLWLGNNQKWVLYVSSDGNAVQRAASSVENATLNTWTHLVGVRNNGKLYLYVNGSLVASTGVEGSPDDLSPSNTSPIRIGTAIDNPGNSRMFYGYIDGLKIVKGKALYTNDFVVPSSAPTTSTITVTPGTTILLLKCDGTNNGTIFTDDGHKALTPTRNGNTITSTTQYKYGTASIYFDGTGDYLSYSTGKNNFNFLNSNFTIECWIRPSNLTGTRTIFSKRFSTSAYQGLLFYLSNNKLAVDATNTGFAWQISIQSTSTLNVDNWYHVAVTRSYDTFKIFIDGNLEGSQTIKDFIITTNTDNVVIGAGGSIGGQEFFGYIDDLRIVRGASLYNSTFTRPSAPLGLYP
jgi:hypothetical protein